ncbi:MAG: TraB family protein [Fusobacteria bacterium]|nr:MAG: TraB family protein [Fusobacteriota bacterium]KAF0229706.1 MAG: TraB family [Fusobacteriota bacterium]
MIKKITKDNKEIILLGTAHVSKASAVEVADSIKELQPDVVAIELCQGRFDNLNNDNKYENLDIGDVIKKGQAIFVMANLLLSAYQKKMGDKIGIRPGAEMIAAIEESEHIGSKLKLVDRPIDVTLKRVTRQLGFIDKISMLASVLTYLFSKDEVEEVNEETIESLKDSSVILDTINELGLKFPNVKKYLLDERDSYMAYKVSHIQGEKILVVLGAAHLEGVYAHLLADDVTREEMKEISAIPKKKKYGHLIALALLILVLFVLVMTINQSPLEGATNIIRWLILTSSLGGIGAFIAGAHPLSILATMIGSPIGAASPVLSSGMIGALVEARLRKPQVNDFSSLGEDIFNFKRWRKNNLLRVFLIFFLASFGSAIGNIIGLKSIFSSFFKLF